jgi:hypothetical protein
MVIKKMCTGLNIRKYLASLLVENWRTNKVGEIPNNRKRKKEHADLFILYGTVPCTVRIFGHVAKVRTLLRVFAQRFL